MSTLIDDGWTESVHTWASKGEKMSVHKYEPSFSLQCRTCQKTVKHPVQGVNYENDENGNYYCAHCAKITYTHGEVVITNKDKGRMTMIPYQEKA